MSMITRCPACKTSFRVVPDQLRISEGWVRCGQCQEIFDATAALQREVAEPMPAPAEAIARPEQPEVMPQILPAQAQPDLSLAFGAIDDRVQPPVVDSTPMPPSSGFAAGKDESAIDSGAQMPHEQLAAAARRDASFMRKMPEQPSWQRRALIGVLGLVAAALLALLALQIAVHERDRIAAMFPQAKPALSLICGELNCSVSKLRQIESVVIDSSSLNKVRGDAYRLSLSLRNNSPYEIEMPALELTLTDSQDQAVMRRVLLAREFAGVAALGTGADWSGAVTVAVRGNGADRFSGYRVLAFYP